MDRPAIGWGIMLIVGVVLVFAGFTNRFGPLLAAIVAPADLTPAAPAGIADPLS